MTEGSTPPPGGKEHAQVFPNFVAPSKRNAPRPVPSSEHGASFATATAHVAPHGAAANGEKRSTGCDIPAERGKCPMCGQSLPEPRDWLLVGKSVTIDAICRAVARAHQLTPDQLRGPRRARVYAAPRHLAMWLTCHLRPDLSLPQIARAFRRDHTTVLYARRKLDEQITRPAHQVWAELQRSIP